MNANAWVWVALIAVVLLCCVPMLFMGRHGKTSRDHSHRGKDSGTTL